MSWLLLRRVRGAPSRRIGVREGLQGTRLRRVLVVVQVGVALVLLRGTGLLGSSFGELMAVDKGFQGEGVLTFGLGLPEGRYDGETKLAAFHHELAERLQAIPGVEDAGVVAWPPATLTLASPGALETLRVPRIEGRSFTWRDDLVAPRVLLVNRAFARTHFPGRSPLGARLELSWTSPSNPAGTVWEIVGVVGDTRARLSMPPAPELILPVAQFPPEGTAYVVRSPRAHPELTLQIRDAVDSRLQPLQVLTMEERLQDSVAERRLALGMTLGLSAVALGLASMGVYGLLAVLVAGRRRELAIRVALGSGPTQLGSLILKECVRFMLVGVAAGTLAFALLAPALRGQLHGVGAHDGGVFLASAATLCVVVLLAALLPVREAARSDPRGAMGSE